MKHSLYIVCSNEKEDNEGEQSAFIYTRIYMHVCIEMYL